MVINAQAGVSQGSPDSWTEQAVSSVPQMKRILLVDDEAHVLRVMKLSLERNGYDVDTALSGDVALSMLREQDYHALITDLDMPKMSGRHLCKTVRSRHGDSILIFVIVSTASDDAVDAVPEQLDWIKSEVNMEALEKPVSLRWIVARLNEFFGDYELAGVL